MGARWMLPLAFFTGGATLLTISATALRAPMALPAPLLVGSSLALGLSLAVLAIAFLSVPTQWPGVFLPAEETPDGPRDEAGPTGEGDAAPSIVVIGTTPVFVGLWSHAGTVARQLAVVGASVGALVAVLFVLGV